MATSFLLVLLCGLPRFLQAAPADRAGYAYVEPQPESRMHPPSTTVALRHGEPLEPGSARFTVEGSASGAHSGSLKLSDDRRTLFFVPDVPFAPGEWVHVRLEGLHAKTGATLPVLAYRFQVRSAAGESVRRGGLEALFQEMGSHPQIEPAPQPSTLPNRIGLPDSLPTDYWPMTVMSSNAPAPGALFLSPFSGLAGIGRLLVVDDRAMPLLFLRWPTVAVDFSLQPNGLLTFFGGGTNRYYALDATGTVVDSFATGNGYTTDLHELRLLPDGHALMMAYDYQFYPMDTVVTGGDPYAFVVGLILQELDVSKNVVFQWRSWDHFKVTDFVECTGRLTDPLVDYVHGNSIELDQDGNLLISSRHLNEVTKINRSTGDVMWRMGMNAKNNQFAFLDDFRGFSHQHDARRLPNGHLTLFDNGNCLGPLYSRALEYEIDEKNKTARLVRVDVANPPVFGGFMGDVQRHDDGGRTVGWGGTFQDPRLTEFHADGTVALEMGFGPYPSRYSYRVKRYDWQPAAFTAPTSMDFGAGIIGTPMTRWIPITNLRSTPMTITQFLSTDPRFVVVDSRAIELEPGALGFLEVRFTPDQLGPQSADLYLRSVDDTSLVARVVHLTGAADFTVGVDPPALATRLDPVLPNPAHGDAQVAFEIPSRMPVKLEVFDLRGRRVAMLAEGTGPAGRQSVRWDTRDVTSGLYFVRLTAAGATFTRRVVVSR